ncbi:MAG: hypothetical protein GF332_03220 [Candidatus Moranbacteria bacterium]|nr:hypothetical protein [Candidatus Moranbacteria bacterium]
MTIQKILLGFEPRPENLLSALHAINQQFGYISKANCYHVAEYFEMAPPKIYGIITGSEVLRDKPAADLEIQVCDSSFCKSKGSDQIVKEVENLLSIKANYPTSKFNLKTISCLGKCQEGPIMVVNGVIYEKVNPAMVDDILKNYL